MEPEDVTELLQSQKTLTDEEQLLMDEQKKWFLEMEPARGEDAMRTAGTAVKDWEYHMNLVEAAAAAECDKIDDSIERSATVGKMPWNSIACRRESSHERRSHLMWQHSETMALISQRHQNRGKTFHQQNNYDSLRAPRMVSVF